MSGPATPFAQPRSMQVVREHACCSLLNPLPYLLFVSRAFDSIPLSVISRFHGSFQ
jgi:hypothetical protein